MGPLAQGADGSSSLFDSRDQSTSFLVNSRTRVGLQQPPSVLGERLQRYRYGSVTMRGASGEAMANQVAFPIAITRAKINKASSRTLDCDVFLRAGWLAEQRVVATLVS